MANKLCIVRTAEKAAAAAKAAAAKAATARTVAGKLLLLQKLLLELDVGPRRWGITPRPKTVAMIGPTSIDLEYGQDRITLSKDRN